jgi:ubiquinone/menaquinone biosynthesis C-methylase UbiE
VLIGLNDIGENSNHKREIITKYNSTSLFYDSRYKEIQESKYQIILYDQDLNKRFILDLGCGTGLLIEYLMKAKKINKTSLGFYIGLDISLNMLLEFKSKLNKLNFQNNVSLLLSDIENLPFRENMFNTIYSITSFQNLVNINMAILESLRVSKNNTDFNFSILKKKLNLEMFLEILKPFSEIEQISSTNDLEDVIIRGKFLKAIS